MKTGTIIFLLLLKTNLTLASESSYQCLSSLEEITSKYVSGEKTILLECNKKEKMCPFSSGSFDEKSNSIALPYNNHGDRGVVFYLNGKSEFVKFAVKDIRNNEKRHVKFKSAGKEFCGEFSRDFGVSKAGMSQTFYNTVSNVSEYFNSSFIGYDFHFVEAEKCKDVEQTASNALATDETEKLINGAIRRSVEEKVYESVHYDLRADMANSSWFINNCDPKKEKKKCYVSGKEKYLELDQALSSCQKNAQDKDLAEFIQGNLDQVREQARAVGFLSKDSKNGVQPTNAATPK